VCLLNQVGSRKKAIIKQTKEEITKKNIGGKHKVLGNYGTVMNDHEQQRKLCFPSWHRQRNRKTTTARRDGEKKERKKKPSERKEARGVYVSIRGGLSTDK